MSKEIFFAGGGTGGHLYPAIAVAEQIVKQDPSAKVRFFCSSRKIDSQILSKTAFGFTELPAKGFSLRPAGIIDFCKAFFQSCRMVKETLSRCENPIVIGVGGFVAAPACWTAYRGKIPVKLINVDIVPGKANKVLARFADEIFVQFEDTRESFGRNKKKVNVVGCPLRNNFENLNAARAIENLGLDRQKKILLITGASSGAQNINDAICSLLGNLEAFADSWQIVHLTGRANFEGVKSGYAGAKIRHAVLDYYDDMPDLLSAAELVIGRSGAVSVAEYAAAEVASICMPYPYHKDRHQYLNAGKLVDACAAIIVDDVPDATDRREWLWEELEVLLKDDNKRLEMKQGCKDVANKTAATKIAEQILTTD